MSLAEPARNGIGAPLGESKAISAPGPWGGSGSGKGTPDYSIAANRTGSRQLHPDGTMATEPSAHLTDADLPGPKGSGRGFQVFGNSLFEGTAADMEEQDDTASARMATPDTVKMNNLFGENTTRHRAAGASPQHSEQGTGIGGAGRQGSAGPSPDLAAVRAQRGGINNSITKMFRRGLGGSAAPERGAPEVQDSGTLVQAFSEEGMEQRSRLAEQPRAGPMTVTTGHAEMQSSSVPAWEEKVKQLLLHGERDDAFHLAAPTSGLVRCCVKRVKAFFGATSFQMYLESGDLFLMAARKRKKSKVSAYVISQDLEDLKRDTDNCLAKLKANFVGTEYMLWGKSPDKSVRKGYASEDLCINFKQTALTSAGGPRVMYVALPLPDADWQPTAPDGSDSLSNSLELARCKELPPYLERKMALLCTKSPEYDETVKGYTLDFQGRVKEASVKNMQLVRYEHNADQHQGGEVLMQFGKVDSDTYALDFTYPLSIHTAFAVALASIDTKLCYTM